MIANAIPSVLAMLLLVTPARAATAQASGADDTTGEVLVQSLAPDGSRIAGLRFEVRSETVLFQRESRFWDVLTPSIGLPDAPRKELSGPSTALVATKFEDMLPGAPFEVRAFDAFKRELGRRRCEALQVNEARLVDVEIVARLALTVRVLDHDDHPVAAATVRANPWLDTEESVFSRFDIRGRTDDRGEYVVPVPLALEDLTLEISRAGRVDITKRLRVLPRDGEPVVLHVAPMRPVVVHVVDANGLAVSASSVSALDDDGGVRVAQPLDPESNRATSAWHIEAVPFGERRIRVMSDEGAATTVTSALDEVTVVLPTQDDDASRTPCGLQVQALTPDGSRIAGVRFEVSADTALFRSESSAWDFLVSSDGPQGWDRRRTSERSGPDASIEVADILPGVPFAVRAIDRFDHEFGSRACDALKPGETRLVQLNVVAPPVLTIRVLDNDERPVFGATIEVGMPGGYGLYEALRWGNLASTTDARGEYVVPEPLAPGFLLRVSRAGRVDITRDLDELPQDGEPIVLHVEPMHPLVIRVVDEAGRPVPVVAVSVFDDDGGERIAVPLDPQGRYAFFERFETATWRVEAVPFGERSIRVTPGWGAATTVTSALQDVTVVLPTHRGMTVLWEPDVASTVGEVTTLRVLGNDVVSHRVTDLERAQLSAKIAVPIGRWTLRLSGLPGRPVRELPIDVRADGSAVILFRSP